MRQQSVPSAADVLSRLPVGVEYSFIKLIAQRIPAPLTMLSWMPNDSNDQLWSSFRTKTYRVIDRRICRLEAALSSASSDEERQHVRALRHQFVEQFLADLETYLPHTNRFMRRILHQNPRQFDGIAQALSASTAAIHFEVWELSESGPVLLDRRTLSSGAPPWGDASVSWIDPKDTDRIYMILFRKYFDLVMRQRPGRSWRSQRDPVGWPALTQLAIPILYDYLRPYYSVRPYHHHLVERSPGKYPHELVIDIRDILRLERPDLASELTAERVTAVIQRYLSKAKENRPMGIGLFQIWPLKPTEKE